MKIRKIEVFFFTYLMLSGSIKTKRGDFNIRLNMRKERDAKIPSNAIVLLICIGMMVSGGLMLKNYRYVFIDELAAPLSTRSGPSAQPIRIRTNKIEVQGNLNEVVKGTGLTEDPYIIENQLFFGKPEDYILIRDSNVSIVIRNCNFQGVEGTHQAAISIQNSEVILVENCTFRGFYRGIEIMDSQFVSIAKSNITRCDCGLYLYNSLFVAIEDNNIGFNKKIGITMVMSGFCTIARNYLYYSASVSPFNSRHELSLEANSSNNWIFHNYFETKSKAVSPILCSKDSTNNTFYHDKRGNYYGYYNKQENGRINDGIYDMAFVIEKDANAIDPYPIANPNRPKLIALGVNPLWVPFVRICFALHVLIGLLMKKQLDIFAKKFLTSILMAIPFAVYFLQLEIIFPYNFLFLFFFLPTRIIIKPRGPFAERVLDPLREMFLIIALGIIIALYHTVEPWALILIFNGIYLWVVYKDYGAIFNIWFKELSKDQKNAEQTKEEKAEETKTTEDQIHHLMQYIENLKNRISIIEESELLEEMVEKAPGLKKLKILRIMKRSGITISKKYAILQPLYLEIIKERLLKMAQKNDGIVRLKEIG
jgi:parallel beta-helix repeat protein